MSNNSNDYAKLIGMQMTPVQMVDTITALRAEVVEARYLHGEAVRMSKSLAAELADARSQLSARDAEVRALRERIRALAESTPIASASLCCSMTRLGRWDELTMHDGGCRGRHGGALGKTYYLHDVSALLTGEPGPGGDR